MTTASFATARILAAQLFVRKIAVLKATTRQNDTRFADAFSDVCGISASVL
jgi:hypothetical protein